MRRGFPRYQTNQTGLKHKDHSDPRGQISMKSQDLDRTIYLPLKRLKLVVIAGRLNPGRLTYFEDPSSGVSEAFPTSSVGINCCRSLCCFLASQVFRLARGYMTRLTWRRDGPATRIPIRSYLLRNLEAFPSASSLRGSSLTGPVCALSRLIRPRWL